MGTMIERMAEAAIKAKMLGRVEWEHLSPPQKNEVYLIVTAQLREMRTATAFMVEAGKSSAIGTEPAACWSAMVEAAIAEHEQCLTSPSQAPAL